MSRDEIYVWAGSGWTRGFGYKGEPVSLFKTPTPYEPDYEWWIDDSLPQGPVTQYIRLRAVPAYSISENARVYMPMPNEPAITKGDLVEWNENNRLYEGLVTDERRTMFTTEYVITVTDTSE